uniref:Uncharacterized protein n=1 Tax=Anguilla anguilla TaxID=7936 RepID=A0A0E9SGD7_ANGAN
MMESPALRERGFE